MLRGKQGVVEAFAPFGDQHVDFDHAKAERNECDQNHPRERVVGVEPVVFDEVVEVFD